MVLENERSIRIGGRRIGPGHPAYIVAEMSANHGQQFERAKKIILAAKESGADAIKLQTYTPDTLTIRCDNEFFRIKNTIWHGKTLYELYEEAYMPWEWQAELKKLADEIGIDFFSTPYDLTAVDFLENLGVPAYKISSFEMVDLRLLKRVAGTGKPILMSTGMATLSEIEDAVSSILPQGREKLALLKCSSSYPALPEQMNLRTIPHLSETFGVPAGLSDHTLGNEVAIAAVSLGACIIEKHFTLSRKNVGPDTPFSMEPLEFRQMVDAIRRVEKALGKISYEAEKEQVKSKAFRRSLFVVQDIRRGELLSEDNISAIRPGHGLPPKDLPRVLGRTAKIDLARGTPLAWEAIS